MKTYERNIKGLPQHYTKLRLISYFKQFQIASYFKCKMVLFCVSLLNLNKHEKDCIVSCIKVINSNTFVLPQRKQELITLRNSWLVNEPVHWTVCTILNYADIRDSISFNERYSLIHYCKVIANTILINKELILPIVLFLDVLINGKQYITREPMLTEFVLQDADKIGIADTSAMIDYIQEKQEVNLTELNLHPRIFMEFLRKQLGH